MELWVKSYLCMHSEDLRGRPSTTSNSPLHPEAVTLPLRGFGLLKGKDEEK